MTTKNKGVARIVVAIAGAALVTLSVSGCATVQGVGRDITSVGRAGEDVIKGK